MEDLMIRICGYVCLATIDGRVVIFGPATERKQRVCENFEGNGLIPFRSRRMAEEARKELRQRSGCTNTRIVYLRLKITESLSEWHSLRRSRSLVVIFDADWGRLLIGRFVPHCEGQYPVPGARLVDNGFQPIRTLESAKYFASEWARQGQSPARIGTFRIMKRRAPRRC